jgi:hypothetical protein
MTLDFLNPVGFSGANIALTNDDDDVGLRGIINKLIELSKSWHATLASPKTTAGAGAWEDSGVEVVCDELKDGVQINAVAHLEHESPGTAASTLTMRLIIGSDSGEEFVRDMPNTITDSYISSVSHSFTGTAGTAYTVKLQIKDDATTAQTVSKATMDVTLGSVQA